jgi:hypothetical protein
MNTEREWEIGREMGRKRPGEEERKILAAKRQYKHNKRN